MTENQNQIPEGESLEDRQYHLAQELKDRGFPRESWKQTQENAEQCQTVEQLDAYLAKLEAIWL